MTKPRAVVCAAVKLYFPMRDPVIICGPRHWSTSMHVSIRIIERHVGDWHDEEQGFIDQYGVFMTREEAWAVAEAAGQIKYRVGGGEGVLYSENLY